MLRGLGSEGFRVDGSGFRVLEFRIVVLGLQRKGFGFGGFGGLGRPDFRDC